MESHMAFCINPALFGKYHCTNIATSQFLAYNPFQQHSRFIVLSHVPIGIDELGYMVCQSNVTL